ncbi:MAG: hypothetical protein K0S24_4912 [Sphingobacterium sp.]|nr:hypothetical protein [Sphingobacterium sp.]
MAGSRKFEQYYPFIIPLAIVGLYYVYAAEAPTNLIIQKIPDLINVALTLSGIALGFLGTMIGAVLSITNSKVMRFIYAKNADKLLMQYIRHAAVINLLVLFFSIIILISSPTPMAAPSRLLLYPWLYTFSSSFLCSYRIIHLLFSLLEAVNAENRNSQQQRKIHTPDSQKLKPPGQE